MEQNYNEQNSYEQNPQQNPYDQNSYGQNPYGQNPYGQNPYGQNPYNQNPFGQNPYGYQQPYQGYPQTRPENVPGLKSLADSAFAKGLASAIMSPWPITSIIAIIMGAMSKRQVAEADHLAAQYGTKAPGKRTAAKILGSVGFGVGIGFTVFWTFYFFLIIGLLSAI